MAFCKNCGAPMEENMRFCANCGASVDGSAAAAVKTNDHTAEFDTLDIAETKYLSIFCYLGILFAIFALVAKPHSKFVRYHANQALVIAVLEFAAGVVCIIPLLGWLAGLVAILFSVVCMIVGIVNCCKGRAKDLPIIGGIRIFS